MKIEYRKGDLFQTDIETIVHGCNAQGVMGAGIAYHIRNRYPEAYKVYKENYASFRQYQIDGELPLGHICYAKSKNKMIINAITQQSYGRAKTRYVSYDAVDKCFWHINRLFSPHIEEIAMPQIGAGLAGGDWNIIEAIIETQLTKIKPVVYLL